jgi:hypothetical protein
LKVGKGLKTKAGKASADKTKPAQKQTAPVLAASGDLPLNRLQDALMD